MQRLGPFQFVYTNREQKQRDLLAHLVKKHGAYKARLIVTGERVSASIQCGFDSPQAKWWEEMMWALKRLLQAQAYGSKVGL